MTEQEYLARTIWGEARGEGVAGMTAVACVIRNRVLHPRWWGSSYATVCLRPVQFSCWNSRDPNFAKLTSVTSADPDYASALLIAVQVASGRQADVTFGADTYANLDECAPAWADPGKITIVIGRHTFFRLELPPPVTA
jgi:spore germination cell wall hydrolase CwlJ-like protein